MRVYGIEGGRFTWGSWILDEHKPAKAALECAFLIYLFAFDIMGLESATFDVRKQNDRTLAFHRRFRAKQVREDAENVYFTYSAHQFQQDRAEFQSIIAESR